MKEFRLPEHVVPVHYEMFFEPDLESFAFSGKEKIDINISRPVAEIVLNSLDLDITKAWLHYDGKELEPKTFVDKKNERVVFKLGKAVKGSVALEVHFKGVLNDSLTGFHRTQYKSKDGSKKHIATTQFEAPYARHAFPCFDEPDKKATFTVTMRIGNDLKAVSNMPAEMETAEGSKKIIKFAMTPLMSTYLLYLGVGDFEFLEDRMDNIVIRAVTVPGKKEQGRYAVDLCKKFLAYFHDYSGISYPLPKMDLIAVPDFAAGAMENWGAITFREVLMLFDPKKTSTRVKKQIAEVLAHELWHQWSGNLVTMKWWNDLWLNESFATFMANKAVENSFPEWQIWEDFINIDTEGALSDDSLKTTHPIEVAVSNPNEIEEIFDTISYGKGGSVLRMVEGYLGKDVFRKGVKKYLSKHRYGNAVAANFWENLSDVSHIPITAIMESWIKQAGYPLVDVKQKGSKLMVSQKRFSKGHDKTVWKIPLVIKTDTSEIRTLFDKRNAEIDMGKEPKWFKVNYEQEGFYRVRYSDENLEKLKALVLKKKISVFDRWGIQNDLFNLSLLGETGLDKYLDFLSAYRIEDSDFILEDIYSNLIHIHNIFSQEAFWKSAWPSFKNHMKGAFHKNFKRLGWEPKNNESHQDSLLRPLSISYLAFAEDPDVLKTGMEKFKKLLEDSDAVHPDIKGPVYVLAARTGDKKTYEKILGLYNTTHGLEEKIRLLRALGMFKDPEILKKALDFSLSGKVKTQDVRTSIQAITSNPLSRKVFLPWVKQNWPQLEKYSKIHYIFMDILESIIISYTGKEKEKEIKAFLNARIKSYKKTRANAFEIMEMNTVWLENNRNVLENYFK